MNYRILALLKIHGIFFIREISDLPIKYSENMHLTLNCTDVNGVIFKELDLETVEIFYREKENVSIWTVKLLHEDEDIEAVKAACLASKNWKVLKRK